MTSFFVVLTSILQLTAVKKGKSREMDCWRSGSSGSRHSAIPSGVAGPMTWLSRLKRSCSRWFVTTSSSDTRIMSAVFPTGKSVPVDYRRHSRTRSSSFFPPFSSTPFHPCSNLFHRFQRQRRRELEVLRDILRIRGEKTWMIGCRMCATSQKCRYTVSLWLVIWRDWEAQWNIL